MVQNYRYLNEWTVKNNYSLPLISDIVENIGIKKVFTKIGLQWGYNNIQMKERDEWKMGFITLQEVFKPTVMFFRLTNSPVIFQTMINKILQNLINTEKVVSFIDNIIVGTENKKGHNKIVEEVVKRLVENALYVKPEKCKQKVQEVRFLKVVIRPKRIKMKEEKMKDVLNQPTSKEVKDIEKILKLANNYQQFIRDFTVIARLLHNMVKKNQKWEQTDRQEKVFQKLKERFTKEPVLAALDLDKK